jgi:aminoglycoside phosphotransferase (APT) family kinase protein
MNIKEYSKRLGSISMQQFQKALDHFNLGQFIRAEAIPFGLFGQNVFVTSSAGEYVLRGAAHYDWQFPKEQFVANLLHERTDVPVPWPYLLDTDEAIFGWKYGYVLMPRMSGLQLANADVLKTISFQDRNVIAQTLGENLRQIQQAQWPFSGLYDLKTQTIQPFTHGFEEWLVGELRQLLRQSLSYHNGATQADEVWVESIIQNAEDALKVPFTPVLVMHDYREANLTVSKQENLWKVSGVFDLMEALVGDGELDLVRQLATYMDENELTRAKAFLDGYQKHVSMRPQANKRLALYLVYDRMIVWEYFHRPDNVSQWMYEEQSVEDWISPYISKLETLL